MAHKYEKELIAVATKYQEINDLLQSSFGVKELQIHKMKLTASNKQNIAYLSRFVNMFKNPGTASGHDPRKPMTHIDGVIIGQPVTKVDTEPTESEKEIFLKSVKELHGKFLSESIDDLLKLAEVKRSEVAFRAVAKKAGLKEFADALIDKSFIEAVKKLIEAKK